MVHRTKENPYLANRAVFMSQPATVPHPPAVQPFSPLAALLSYLVPGLGQIYQGRVGKGLLFMIVLLGMFMYGQYLGNWMNVYLPVLEERVIVQGQVEVRRNQNPFQSVYHRLHFAGQFWIGMAAWPAVWQYLELPVPDKDNHPFWHDFQKGPRPLREELLPHDQTFEARLNQFLVDRDKTPDLSWVYTIIAGVLNILVIYDAFAGPVHSGRLKDQAGPVSAAGTEASPS